MAPKTKPPLLTVVDADMAYLHDLDDNIVVCKGQRHDFAKIRPGKLPRGLEAVPQKDGCYQIRQRCRNGCGVVRTMTTLPGGVFDMDVQYRYEYENPAFHAPRDTGLTARDYMAEAVRRAVADQLLLTARAAKQAAIEAEAAGYGVLTGKVKPPAVTFRAPTRARKSSSS